VLFWAAVVATATAILAFLLLILQAAWWLVTRPIVWLIIRPVEYMCGAKDRPPNRDSPTARAQAKVLPIISDPVVRPSITEKVEQLGKLQSLLDNGAINQNEFDRMKNEVLAT